jgi:hypothetical protein
MAKGDKGLKAKVRKLKQKVGKLKDRLGQPALAASPPLNAAKPVSPLAPASFPSLPAIAGAEFAAIGAGIKYQNRKDVMLVRLAPGTVIRRGLYPLVHPLGLRARLSGQAFGQKCRRAKRAPPSSSIRVIPTPLPARLVKRRWPLITQCSSGAGAGSCRWRGYFPHRPACHR